MERQDIFESMTKYATDIKNMKTRILSLKNQAADINVRTKEVKLEIEREVANEVDQNGKAVFSNADKRSAETTLRLDGHPTYNADVELMNKLLKDVEELEIELSYNSYMFRAYESYANYR